MMQQHFVKQTNRRFESRCCDGRSQLCCPIDNWKPWFFQILDKLRLALEILANWSCCVFTIVKFTLAHSAWSLLLLRIFSVAKDSVGSWTAAVDNVVASLRPFANWCRAVICNWKGHRFYSSSKCFEDMSVIGSFFDIL